MRSICRLASIALVAVLLLPLTACTSKAPEETTAKKPPVETVTIPASLFASAEPADAVMLVAAKESAQEGDRIVFEARVGGRMDPFIENRAVFFVTDPSRLSCDQIHGDQCKTPWDYCCEPKDSLLKHMATVQIVDADGRPLRVSLGNHQGLEPLKTVIVSGTVSQMDESGTFVVDAEAIHVRSADAGGEETG